MNPFNWQRIKRNIKPTFSRPRLAALLLGLGALLGLTWLGITTQTVVVGQRVRELEAKLDRVNHENAKLEYDIAVLTQPKRIADRAAALGLHPATPGQTVYLNVNYTPRVASAQAQPSATEYSFNWAMWWNEVLSWLSADTRAAEASR